MMEHPVLTSVIGLLAASVALLALFERMGLPILLAYLLVGIVLGPAGLSWIPHTEDLHFLAEFGVVLLLFTIGLEFSVGKLWTLRRHVFGLGGAQVVVTAALGALLAWGVGLAPGAAFVVGGALALSSTAVVSRELSRRDELGQPHGRLSVAVLIFQDLAVVPFLILIPVLADDSGNGVWGAIGWALLTGAIVIALMMAAGRWMLRPIFRWIAERGSEELFTLTALLFALAASWLTEFAGLSLALGAFLAGVMLSETEYRHRLSEEIRPFRDVLLGFFFVVIGMMLDLAAVGALLPWVLLALAIERHHMANNQWRTQPWDLAVKK
ncbi:monovalent cation:proton antiporter-2 (CPA2) family protein [Sedimenticola selenatireducens]|uniref:monovalent cation:proton antiporter-2 (CPA2) family protein n=1 Tax=Sedimenticola selenatireducens TaxID=191960 RepID=UPI0009FC4850|nr:monovalent cation:proton antiporter-2 (CPA2) family protein [Sedimenticola selenatireducens]